MADPRRFGSRLPYTTVNRSPMVTVSFLLPAWQNPVASTAPSVSLSWRKSGRAAVLDFNGRRGTSDVSGRLRLNPGYLTHEATGFFDATDRWSGSTFPWSTVSLVVAIAVATTTTAKQCRPARSFGI